jgi:hypothetical protein
MNCPECAAVAHWMNCPECAATWARGVDFLLHASHGSLTPSAARNRGAPSAQAAGATVHHAVEARATEDAGVGIHLGGNDVVHEGTTLLIVPAELMLHPVSADEAGLALTLATARRNPQSTVECRNTYATLQALTIAM